MIVATLLAGPGVASGQSAGQITRLEALVENLEKQAASLQAELKAIREELAGIKTGMGISSRPLRRGETSNEVQKIQEFLKELPGIYPEGLTTGFFGELTEKAIRKFQERYGIEETGVVDAALYAKINELRGGATSGVSVATSTVSIATSTVASSSLRFSFVYPVYGDRLIASTSQTIQWNSSEQQNTVPTVRLDLYSGGAFIETIVSSTPNTGRYEWTPPSRLAGSTFTIKLWSAKYPNNTAESIAFPVVSSSQSTTANTSSYGAYTPPASTSGSGTSAATSATGTSTTSTATSTTASSTTASSSVPAVPVTVTVTSPGGGETWTQGNTYQVAWTWTGSAPYVNIELWYGGEFKETIAPWIANTGSWSWALPTDRSYETGANYSIRIKVYVQYNESAHDDSTGSFGIVLPAVTTLDSSGLIGFWKFDGNGNNEIAGNPNAVTVGNATFKTSGGKVGGYLYLPGSSDYAKIPYNSIFDLQDAFTIEFWFRQRSNQSFRQDLIYKGSNSYYPSATVNYWVWRQLWNEYNFGPIQAAYVNRDTSYYVSVTNTNQLSHNEWHHVVYSKGSTGSEYYLDGALIYRNTEVAPAKTNTADIIIGNPAPDTDIDNLRIYSRAITSLEAVQRYSNPTLTMGGKEEISKQLADITSALSILSEKIKSFLAR